MNHYYSDMAMMAERPESEVVHLPVQNIKYVQVEIKTPGFMTFKSTIPVRGDLQVSGLIDRFHNLHPEVENTVKRCGHMYPAIENRYIHESMDILIEFSKNEWVRLTRVSKPDV